MPVRNLVVNKNHMLVVHSATRTYLRDLDRALLLSVMGVEGTGVHSGRLGYESHIGGNIGSLNHRGLYGDAAPLFPGYTG